jgi:hypothetical protein
MGADIMNTPERYKRFIESPYGDDPHNFHVAREDDQLHVTLTYPPRTNADNKNNQLRYVVIDQESVRASDGIRVWYCFDRDGYVIEQNDPIMQETPEGPVHAKQVDRWREVFFAKSWALMSPEFEEAIGG